MYKADVYKVMFGSPSDIEEELIIFQDIIYGWNNTCSEKERVVLLPLHWKKSSYSSLGANPQKLLNKQIVEKSDLLICVFASRIGSKTDTHDSGTVEEIDEHIKAGKSVMIFFKKQISIDLDNIDIKQIEEVKKFKQSIKSKGIYSEFSTKEEFRDILFTQLQLFINDHFIPKKESSVDNSKTIIESHTAAKYHKDELSGFDIERLKAWTSVDDPQFYQVHFEGGGCIYGLGATNQYEIKNGREKIEWNSFFEKLEGLDLIDVEKHNKEGRPVYRLKSSAYEYVEKSNEIL